jgi:hypothetical protein
VANNVARQAAVEDFWAAHQGGVPDGTRLDFKPLSPAQVREFYNPVDLFNSGNVVDTRGVMQVSGVPASWVQSDPVPVDVSVSPVALRPVGVKVSMVPGSPATRPPIRISSSGASQPVEVDESPAFSLSSVPMWALAGAGVLALFAFGGSRGR